MKGINIQIWVLLLSCCLWSCNGSRLPNTRYYQYRFEPSYQLANDELLIRLENPLASPLRVWIQSEHAEVKRSIDPLKPVTLDAKGDTLIKVPFSSTLSPSLTFVTRLGDIHRAVHPELLALPFPKNKKYRIIQGVNSTPTHNSDYSRYAVDFSLAVGDTVTAAADGVVVGIVNQYQFGGEGPEWRNFSNFITLYHSQSGVFTQYAHLKKDGVLIQMGEQVKRGQAIGLAGMTGQTNVEHLHFNALIPVYSEDGLASYPVDFEGYPMQGLKRGDWVEH